MSLTFILTISIFAFLHFIGLILFAFYENDWEMPRLIHLIKTIFMALLITPLQIIMSPIMFLFTAAIEEVQYRKLAIRTFTIHKLTDKNKITLEQLGFKYGSFVSRQNINYRGYRYGRGTIIVLPNGRVSHIHKKLLNAEEKAIVGIVANLPKE